MITSKGLIQLGFQPKNDFVLHDDGDGPYIEKWLSNSARPTTAVKARHPK